MKLESQSPTTSRETTFKRRNPLLVVFLSILTMGIYGFYWIYQTTKDIRNHSAKAPNEKLIFLFLVPGINFLVYLYFFWRFSKATAEVTQLNHILLFLLWFFISPVAMFLTQNELNKESPLRMREKKEVKTKKRAPVNIREKTSDFLNKLIFVLTNRISIPHLKDYLDKAGIEVNEKEVPGKIMNVAFLLNLGVSLYLLYRFFVLEKELLGKMVHFFLTWFLGIMIIIFILYFLVALIRNLRNKGGKSSLLKIDYRSIGKSLLKFSVLVNIVLNIYLFYAYSNFSVNIIYVKILFTVVVTILLWLLGVILLLLLLWALFFILIDVRIFQRRKQIEEVFPDFLQLTSANISSGMTVDRALWFAVRPRFGVLAKEMESVAKKTLVGEKLSTALQEFAKKYDSLIVQRSINLLLEGMDAGGELAELLNRIANNIQETRIIKKEMAASVTTYVIFIGFASLVGAPFLFGLSTQLVIIMKSILGSLNLGSNTQSFGGIGSMLTASPDAISIHDYKIFAVTCIIITTFFSSLLITIIRKGEIKEDLQLIPMFVGAGIVIYLIASTLLSILLSGFFAF
ncbi:type II secretion system F family protein [Candidatus Woesearchaeota archaeon]|nr:type II secretion system F family protein [Candidatus Woesearchaeota archaeon]